MSAKRTSRSKSRGSSSRGFDREVAELEALKDAILDPEAVQKLRKALNHRNNFVVSKAAKLIEANELSALLPEVLAAYDRFFVDAEKTDPQCWAKNALVKALVKLEHRDKEAYLRGLRHHQMEGTWGGTSDTAGTLRGACAHALVDCPGISDQELLSTLLELFIGHRQIRTRRGGGSDRARRQAERCPGVATARMLGNNRAQGPRRGSRRCSISKPYLRFRLSRVSRAGVDNLPKHALAGCGASSPEALAALTSRRDSFADVLD